MALLNRWRWLLLSVLAAAAPARAQVDESALKAAFVYNIVAFSQWNTPRDAQVVSVCADAGPSLDGALQALDGRALGTRTIAVHPRAAGVACDVLVRGRERPAAAAPGVLVICDGCELPDEVTAVSLVRVESRVRFEIATVAAGRAGLTFSSQLMQLARRVL
ncbi:YfiR family protein [Pseudoxanthomonas sp. 10H]|uniref:YfiR family protein n=1 Tax=Pseudoxanthomonas sp. 10H TaxID=3242729 RepID=UPI0035565DCC